LRARNFVEQQNKSFDLENPPYLLYPLIITMQKQRKLEEEKRKVCRVHLVSTAVTDIKKQFLLKYNFVSLFNQRDEEEAAKLYKEFVEDFGDGEDAGMSTAPPFVSGGIVEGNDAISNYSAGNAKGSTRRHFIPPPNAVTPTAATPTVHGKEDNINSEDASISMIC
jgi:hypothetical protein